MSDVADQSEGSETPRSTPPIDGWSIEEAKLEDADLLAAIQIDAFKSNELFKVQFPTLKAIDGYSRFLAERIKEEIEHSHAHVLVIRERRGWHERGPNQQRFGAVRTNSPVAFAIWRPPYPNEDADLNASKQWPEQTNVDMIVRWGTKVNEAYRTAMGDDICYRLDWLVTHRHYVGQGLGSMLLNWGFDLARSRGLAVYLESTIVSESWYINRGFKRVAEMSIPLDRDSSETYSEVGLLWNPK